MISLQPDISNIIYENKKGTLEIGNKTYFYKCVNSLEDGLVGIEEIIEELAKSIGLKCAHYELLKINDRYFYISENISEKFKTAIKLGLYADNLFAFEKRLKEINLYHDDVMYDIVKMYLFDIFILNFDRTGSNWGIICDKKNEVCILDNTLSFDFESSVCISSKPDRGYFNILFRTMKNAYPSTTFNLEDLYYFLNYSSDNYKELFMTLYKKLTPDFVLEVIDKVSDKNNISNPYLFKYFNIYTSNYAAITKMLESRRI